MKIVLESNPQFAYCLKSVLQQRNLYLLIKQTNQKQLYTEANNLPMDLLKQCRFYGVRLSQLADASGFTQSYVRQVLLNERNNPEIKQLAHAALNNRKEELLTALLKESA